MNERKKNISIIIKFRIYPEIFSTKMIYHWSSGIFQDNNRTQKLALNFLLRFIQMNEDQFQSTTIWPYIIHVYVNIFQVKKIHHYMFGQACWVGHILDQIRIWLRQFRTWWILLGITNERCWEKNLDITRRSHAIPLKTFSLQYRMRKKSIPFQGSTYTRFSIYDFERNATGFSSAVCSSVNTKNWKFRIETAIGHFSARYYCAGNSYEVFCLILFLRLEVLVVR